MTARPLDKPRTKAKVQALILDGKTDSEIAALMHVTRQAVWGFRQRHAAELGQQVAVVEQAIQDIALKDKEARIRELAWLYEQSRKEAEEYGINITEVEYRDDGETRIETRNYRGAMVREMRGILKDIAEEMGERQKPDSGATVQVATVVNIVRNVPELGV